MSNAQYVALTSDEGSTYVVLIGEVGENRQSVFSRAAEKILPRADRQGDIWQQTQLKNLAAVTMTFARRYHRGALETFELDALDASGINTAALGL